MKKHYLNKQGMSLIELMVVIGILGMVILVAYTMVFYGTTSFRYGTDQANLQQSARIVEAVLKNQLRNATRIQISQTALSYENKLKIENQIFYQSEQALSDSVIKDLKIKINGEGERAILEFMVETEENEQNHSLSGQILLNNLTLEDFQEADFHFRSLNEFDLYYETPQHEEEG